MIVRHPRHAASQVAMALTVQGFSVFPCRGSNKRPCTPHGFHDAVNVTSDAQALFQSYPGELIGVPTGPANGFDVLDIDPRHGGDDWLARHRSKLPRTRTHTTRSGGLHFLFRHHQGVRNSESKIASGVDTRGEGGYIIWWPAVDCPVASDAPIAPWPAWLLSDLLPKPLVSSRAKAPVREISDTRIRRVLQRCVDRVSRATPGQRHYALRSASYAIGGLLGDGLQKDEAVRALLQAAVDAGGSDVDERNALATITSGLEKGALAPLTRFG